MGFMPRMRLGEMLWKWKPIGHFWDPFLAKTTVLMFLVFISPGFNSLQLAAIKVS
jgi:hypothetical protein